jgi:hypothetical protein
LLDSKDRDLLQSLPLSPEAQLAYDELRAQLFHLPPDDSDCTGDGNIDFRVDEEDLYWWDYYATTTGA